MNLRQYLILGVTDLRLSDSVRLRARPGHVRLRSDIASRQPPRNVLRMLPPLAQNTSTTPISEPPATTPDATGKVNSSASFGFRFWSKNATSAPRKNKSP